MKRKDYQKPTMEVVMYQQRSQILVGSNGVRSMRSTYGDATPDTWEEN